MHSSIFSSAGWARHVMIYIHFLIVKTQTEDMQTSNIVQYNKNETLKSVFN
jgi:hypothetical protein